MFFVGIFSNILPLIILSIVSLGIYMNGIDPSKVLFEDSSFQLTQKIDYSTDNVQVEFVDNTYSQIVAIDTANSNYRPLIVRPVVYLEYQKAIFAQNIPINSFRGSPTL